MATDISASIKEKLVKGVVALVSRTVLLQIISFGATFVLTILLSPEIFGVFFLVSSVISFFSYFSDIGFAAALVQRREEPSRDDLVTAFTMQQLLIGGLIFLGWIGSSWIGSFYRWGADAIFLFHALLIAFFLASLKTIPSIILERKLDFSRLVIPQIVETIGFYGVTIICAQMGLGVMSFGWGALVRGITGMTMMYILCPWKPGLWIKRRSLQGLLSYGVPFQVNSLLALVKDDGISLFLGRLLLPAELGYIGWAKKWAEAPLRIIMDNIIRITFPAFSRMQSDTELLRKGIERSFFILSYCIFPATVLLIVCVDPLIHIIPRYQKWEPAIFSFYLFALASLFSSFSSPVVNALNATGKIRQTLYLMIGWTAASWILIPYGVVVFGFSWVSCGAAVISLSAAVPLFLLYRYLPFSFFSVIYKPAISVLIMGIVGYLGMYSVEKFVSFLIVAVMMVLIYLFFSIVWMKKELDPYLQSIVVWKK